MNRCQQVSEVRQNTTRKLFSLGTDPEFFAVDGEGEVVPAFTFLPKKPRGYWSPFWDGFQAEFRVQTSGCLDSFVGDLSLRLGELRNLLPKGTKLTIKNVLPISEHFLESSKPEHVELGCDPSLNAYGMAGDFPGDGRKLKWRFAGGHIHFGIAPWKVISGYYRQVPLEAEEALRVVRALDAILGICAVSLAANIDDPMRRRYYGLAGEFRLPKHGLEYRTLSNFWLCHPAFTYLTMEIARLAVQVGQGNIPNYWRCNPEHVPHIINQYDVGAARKIVRDNRALLQAMLGKILQRGSRLAVQAVLKGVDKFVDPEAIQENWKNVRAWRDFARWKIAL